MNPHTIFLGINRSERICHVHWESPNAATLAFRTESLQTAKGEGIDAPKGASISPRSAFAD